MIFCARTDRPKLKFSFFGHNGSTVVRVPSLEEADSILLVNNVQHSFLEHTLGPSEQLELARSQIISGYILVFSDCSDPKAIGLSNLMIYYAFQGTNYKDCDLPPSLFFTNKN